MGVTHTGIRIMRILLVLTLLTITACSVGFTSKVTFSLNGDRSVSQKMKLAKEIGDKLWSGSLKINLKNKHQELVNINLDKVLGIHLNKTTYEPTDEKKPVKEIVTISCTFKSKDKSIADSVIKTCKQAIQAELELKNIEFKV